MKLHVNKNAKAKRIHCFNARFNYLRVKRPYHWLLYVHPSQSLSRLCAIILLFMNFILEYSWTYLEATKPEWPNGIQRCACRTNSHRFEPLTSTNACRHDCKCREQKGSAAMLTSIQSAGVTPEVNLNTTQVRKHTRDPPWLWNPGQTSPEVQNKRDISDLTKRTYILQKPFKKLILRQ